MSAKTTPSAVRPAQEPARVQPVPVSPAPTSTGRVLFGIVSEEEIDELMQSGMASGGLVFGSPPPQGPSVKWDPATRAPLSFSQPSNMLSLRRSTAGTKKRPVENAPALTLPLSSPKMASTADAGPSPPSLSVPSAPPPIAPVASTSRTLAQPPPIQARVIPEATSGDVPPAPQPALAPAIDLPPNKSPARPTQPPPTGSRPPTTALSLRPDGPSLNRRHSITSPTSPPRLPPARAQPSPAPALSFAKALKPPAHIDAAQLVEQSPRSQQQKQQAEAAPSASAKPSPTSTGATAATPTETPLASSRAASTAPTSPLIPSSSSPPTRTTSPKPALKPKSWADLVRPPAGLSQTSPNRKRVSIALPGDPPSPAPVAAATVSPSVSASPAAAPRTPAEPQSPTSALSAIPRAPVQNAAAGPVVPLPPTLDGAGPAIVPPQQAPPPPAPKRKLEEILSSVETKQRAPLIQPRGLVNKGNQCFENSILQVLLFCGPMYNLLRLLGQETTHDFSNRYPTLEAMIAFVDEFTVGRRGEADGQTSVHIPSAPHRPTITDAFAPEMVYDALKGNKRFDVMMRGSQEDAQEFLGFLLDTLHEELLALIDRYDGTSERPAANGSGPHSRNGSTVSSGGADSQVGGDDEWLEVGSKGRMATTRSSETRESPLSRIFGGKQRSTLRVPGQKDSATVEPFLTLQLDIQPDSVETIEDALANMCLSDTVTDYSTRPGVRVDAMKQLALEALPPVLILHLKRFSYDAEAGGTIKNHKVVGFGTELEIAPQWVSPAGRRHLPIKYSLSAVVYHHGRQATGGHYTAAIRKQDGQWANLDDTLITDVGPADVAVDRTAEVLRLSLPSAHDGLPERSAYLLFLTRV